MKYMLDTNIVSYYLKGLSPAVTQRIEAAEVGDTALSVVVAGELWHGLERLQPSAMRSKLENKLDFFLQFTPVLALDPSVAREYARVYAQLEKKGTIIGANDLWIAAHAKALGGILVTNNKREFERVKGLKLENWSEE
jgi:tRNA(fMet)-specific endonuclease VapC